MNGRALPGAVPSNPLLQFVALVVGGLLLVGAVLIGAVILAAALAFALVLAIVVWVRFWWLRRKLSRAGRPGQPRPFGRGYGEVIEVEYSVVDERDPKDRRD